MCPRGLDEDGREDLRQPFSLTARRKIFLLTNLLSSGIFVFK